MIEGIKVLHYLPGRLRLRVAALKNEPDLVTRLEQELAQVPGVRRVEAKHSTGSVLLVYDSETLRSEESLEKLRGAAQRLLAPADMARLDSYIERLM